MTRKDYVRIAGALKWCEETLATGADLSADERTGAMLACAVIADELADELAAENPRFDRQRFLAAARRD